MVKGVADADVWANEARWGPLVDQPATTPYLRRGCLPLIEALGPDAGPEEQDALLRRSTRSRRSPRSTGSRSPSATTTPRSGWSPTAPDLFERLRIGEDWPVTGFPQAYVDGAADPASGRIGYSVPRPPAAVGLALLEELPFALCDEVVPQEEPTGR